MFVLSKRNVDLPGPGGVVHLSRGQMADVPAWAADTAYFKALVADGKIVPSATSDKSMQAAAEKKSKKAKEEIVTPVIEKTTLGDIQSLSELKDKMVAKATEELKAKEAAKEAAKEKEADKE